jgi:hypothetical protein
MVYNSTVNSPEYGSWRYVVDHVGKTNLGIFLFITDNFISGYDFSLSALLTVTLFSLEEKTWCYLVDENMTCL